MAFSHVNLIPVSKYLLPYDHHPGRYLVPTLAAGTRPALATPGDSITCWSYNYMRVFPFGPWPFITPSWSRRRARANAAPARLPLSRPLSLSLSAPATLHAMLRYTLCYATRYTLRYGLHRLCVKPRPGGTDYCVVPLAAFTEFEAIWRDRIFVIQIQTIYLHVMQFVRSRFNLVLFNSKDIKYECGP